jgi:hypothetical protein
MLYNLGGGGGVRPMGGMGFRNKGSRRRGLTLYLSNIVFTACKDLPSWELGSGFLCYKYLKIYLKFI